MPETVIYPAKRRASAVLFLLIIIATVSILSACTTTDNKASEPDVVEFSVYRENTLELLRERRAFQDAGTEFELMSNAPREWQPRGSAPDKGILLVHGLGDSPWSFNDIGPALAEQGFLVRTLLLPGHGTRPDDLQDVTFEQWRQVVHQQAATMQRDVGKVYMGGFSTGANLALDYAYFSPEIAGLVLFSPGFRSNSTWDWLTPLVAKFRPWLFEPDGLRPMQNSVRYLTTPTNGFAQFYRSSKVARSLLGEHTYDKPVFMAVAQHDSVLNTSYLLNTFQTRFTHPDSRLIWYGTPPSSLKDSKRIIVREDRLPEHHISQFSHMGILFSPGNRVYGEQVQQRFCWNGQSAQDMQACLQGAPVWYSDWGYQEPGKVHARLTFNPYFEWQMSVIKQVLSEKTVESSLLSTKNPL
ncbi:carboxylesterase [Klebsiella sp. BIGb0407]|uniref:alpha/beta hydrolase n=1 Tax=Klebsiella sp. BIGb0407 TaxID=2940603 RepID=UPI00216701FE|nr:alpha/beta fold hydrolase [Klebsiella sp. BIGb0407]MCS3433521.1 esterase/lipase [Klebsiella sp. BIGb0407]